MQNITQTAISNADFSTLVTAIKAASLVETLSGTGPFTVFAPTNEAFAKIPEDALKDILGDKAKLTAILTHHVLAGKVLIEDVLKMTEAKTLEGSKLHITAESEAVLTQTLSPEESTVEVSTQSGIMINEASVINPDIICSNGVIHAIDTVLMV